MKAIVLMMRAKTEDFDSIETISAFIKDAQELPPADRADVYETLIHEMAQYIEGGYALEEVRK